MKRIVLFTLMVLVSFYAKAQLYSSEACFYIEAGRNLASTEYIAAILFKGENLYRLDPSGTTINYIMSNKTTGGIKNKGTGNERGGIMDYLKEDSEYFDNQQNCRRYETWNYDVSLSTLKRKVYKRFLPYNSWAAIPAHPMYLAISQDKSSIIQWEELDGKIIGNKRYYVQIDKEQLLPKAINRDFLYE